MHHLFALTLLWLGHFLVDFMLGIWPVFKTISALDLGYAGIMASACAFVGEGMQLIFGRLTDQGYRNRLIAFGIFLTMANALLAFTSSYALLLVLLLMTCIGSGAFHPSAVAFIGSLTDKQKGLYISIFASGGACGMALSQVAFSHSYEYFNGNTLPLLIPASMLLFTLFFIRFFNKEPTAVKNTSPYFHLKIFKEYFKDSALRNLYLSQVCNQTIFWGTIFLLPDVLAVREYEDSITYGGGHMAFIIGSAFMMIPSGYLADRYSARKVILISSVAGMILYFTFLFLPFLPSLYLLILLVASGAFVGIVQPVAVALGNNLGKNNPGLVSAFTMGMVWCVSETIGPVSAGLFTKLFTEDAPAKSLMLIGTLFPFLIYHAYRLPLTAEEQKLA